MIAARSTLLKCLGTLCLTVALIPAVSSAQAQGQGLGARGGMGMGQGPQQLNQVLAQLDLTADQRTKIDGLLKQAAQDRRDAMQGLQDATPEERQQKMQDMQKNMADTKTKVEAELTPEQKAKYYPLVAKMSLKTITDFMSALKTQSAKMDITEDLKKNLSSALDDTGKSLDGLKTDADGVKDADTAAEFQKSVSKVQQETTKQILDILGQEDARTLMRNAMQSMRPAGARGTAREAAPASQPAAK